VCRSQPAGATCVESSARRPVPPQLRIRQRVPRRAGRQSQRVRRRPGHLRRGQHGAGSGRARKRDARQCKRGDWPQCPPFTQAPHRDRESGGYTPVRTPGRP
jgi:hypothetical protein